MRMVIDKIDTQELQRLKGLPISREVNFLVKAFFCEKFVMKCSKSYHIYVLKKIKIHGEDVVADPVVYFCGYR